MRRTRFWIACLLGCCLSAVLSAGQQSQSKRPNPLVTGKLVAVSPMPLNLDQWILDDLRVWGKYKLTGDPEGASLVMEAHAPERATEYEMRAGIPQPRRRREGTSAPATCSRAKGSQTVATINVVDWVTGENLWYAHLLDRKPRKDDLDVPAGPHTDIFVRGMAPDQIAQRLTARLREYVSQLERSSAGRE